MSNTFLRRSTTPSFSDAMHISVIEVPLKNNVWLKEQALVSQCGEREEFKIRVA